MKTKEEILKASYYWHAASDGVYYREDAVYEAMESYSQQSNRQKEDRIKSLEQGIERIMNQEICGDGWFHAQQVINICNELLNK